MDREVYHGLVGHINIRGRCWWAQSLHDDQVGQPCQVSFDPQVIEKREDEKHDVVGFYHTHPQFFADPSGRDYKTMMAWTVAFGKPLVCCIRGVDGLKAHWFVDDETPHITCWMIKVRGWYFGRIPAVVRNKIRNKKWQATNSITSKSTGETISSKS